MAEQDFLIFFFLIYSLWTNTKDLQSLLHNEENKKQNNTKTGIDLFVGYVISVHAQIKYLWLYWILIQTYKQLNTEQSTGV
jgi:hypothetical protein